jgi:hypothetical protein
MSLEMPPPVQAQTNLTAITWSHATNSQNQLTSVLNCKLKNGDAKNTKSKKERNFG